MRRVGELACLFNGGGVITLVTLVSPYRAARDAARQRHEEQHLKFLEVFMNVPIDEVRCTASVDLRSRRVDGVWAASSYGGVAP